MRIATIAAVALAAGSLTPAMAQTATPAPTTEQLNAATSAYVDTRAEVQQAEETAQHRADREAYMAALIAHDRAVDRADARYARQQAAYADAMAAWRLQVEACHHGRTRACNAPTPTYADFY